MLTHLNFFCVNFAWVKRFWVDDGQFCSLGAVCNKSHDMPSYTWQCPVTSWHCSACPWQTQASHTPPYRTRPTLRKPEMHVWGQNKKWKKSQIDVNLNNTDWFFPHFWELKNTIFFAFIKSQFFCCITCVMHVWLSVLPHRTFQRILEGTSTFLQRTLSCFLCHGDWPPALRMSEVYTSTNRKKKSITANKKYNKQNKTKTKHPPC